MFKTISFDGERCMLAQYIQTKVTSNKGTLVRVESCFEPTGEFGNHSDISVHNSDVMSADTHSFNSLGQLVVNRARPPKNTQVSIINLAAKRADAAHFQPMRCWNTSSITGLKNDDLVVIKPNNGARGVFQFVVKFADWRSFMSSVGGDVTESRLRKAGIRVTTEGLRPSETAEDLNTGGLSLWNYVDNIDYEVRIITGADGKPGFSHRRVRQEVDVSNDSDDGKSLNVPFMQVSPEDVSVGKYALQDALFPEDYDKFGREIEAVLRRMNRPLYSFDIFVTMDKKWGIFEYSHEYSVAEIHADWLKPEFEKYFDLLHDIKDNYDANLTPAS